MVLLLIRLIILTAVLNSVIALPNIVVVSLDIFEIPFHAKTYQ